jgi:hypothetical protein
MTWQRSLKLVLAIQIMVLAGLYALFHTKGVKSEFGTLGNISSRFPIGTAEPLDLNGWKGFRLPARLRVFWKDFPDPVGNFRELEEKSLRNVYLKRPLSLFDGGVYVVWRRPQGYTLTCMFRNAGRIYWLDLVSTSMLDQSRRAFDDCILNLRIGGEAAAPGVREELNAISRSVSIWVIQSPNGFILMLGVFFLLFGSGMSLIMRLAGSMPRGKNPEIDFCSPYATLVERRIGRRSSMPCCLCLEGAELVVYRFRRPTLRIPLGKERGDLRLEKKSIRYERYQIFLGEEELQRWRIRLGL